MPQDAFLKTSQDKATITDRTAHRLHKTKMRLEYTEKLDNSSVLRLTILPLFKHSHRNKSFEEKSAKRTGIAEKP